MYLIHFHLCWPTTFTSFLFILFKLYFQVGSQSEAEKLSSWQGQIKSHGGLLLTSKVPRWVCFCVQRLHWEMNLEPWQACRCSPTWTHAEGDPSARAALIPHWHTALSTTSNRRSLMHRMLQKKIYCAVNTWCLSSLFSYVATTLHFQFHTALIMPSSTTADVHRDNG